MSTQTEPVNAATYDAAHQTAVFVDRSNLGVLKISGETRLDLIHRMSTQGVNGLAQGEGTATILTTDIGRIIDRLILYASSETVYALTSEDNADPIARYLMRFVFFQDDFQLEDLSANTAIFGVYGPLAGKTLVGAGFDDVELPLHHWREATLDGVTASCHRTDPIAGDGYFVMGRAADKERLQQRLLDQGLSQANDTTFELLRIESGIKRFGHELGLDYIPLEADLWPDVSFHKGCYIGQEIIARMESRSRLAKKLVKLHPVAPVDIGAEIIAEGKKVGSVTSAASGPQGAIALGYVKTSVLDDGKAIMIGNIAVNQVESPTPVG